MNQMGVSKVEAVRLSFPRSFQVFLLVSLCICFSASRQSFAKQEDWYWGFDLGWGRPGYSGDLATGADALAATSGISRLGLAIGLGFYWPLEGKTTVLGVASSGINDQFTNSATTLSIHSSLLAFSAIHTFGIEPYDGFFIRGDAGLSFISISVTGTGTSIVASTKAGFGAMAGAGYGLALSDETRLLFQGKFSFIHSGGYNVTGIHITVGPTF